MYPLTCISADGILLASIPQSSNVISTFQKSCTQSTCQGDEVKLAKSPGTEKTTEMHEGLSIATLSSDEKLTKDLPSLIEEGSDKEEDPCDDNYEGALTSEETTAI